MTEAEQKRQRIRTQVPERDQEDEERDQRGAGLGSDDHESENGTLDRDHGAVVAERDGYLDQLMRERADFANYRRRVEEDRVKARQLASRDILVQLLPVMDDFNRALAAVPAEQASSGWVSGTAMVGKKLANVLERAGVTPVEAVGQRFDPAVHEAVATEPGTSGEFVVDVYQEGYKLGQSLLRPAMVTTGDAPAELNDESSIKTANDKSA